MTSYIDLPFVVDAFLSYHASALCQLNENNPPKGLELNGLCRPERLLSQSDRADSARLFSVGASPSAS